ncbi:MAG: hypothetical protein K2N63_08285 [Lachnospiraceae bacterium]|nr:hypothetical protein [Lachnospiraceae bacterium]
MKPFSAIYFVRENKTRCILLMFMLFLGYAAYLGGLYVTNVRDNWELPISYYQRVVRVNDISGDKENFDRFLEEVEESGKAIILKNGSFNAFNWNSIMGFENGQASLTFLTVQDFKTYCEAMGITCDFGNLKSGSMVMSERFAKNVGMKIGDKVDKDYDENIFREFSLDATTKEDGYFLYFITEEEDYLLNVILISKEGVSGEEVYEFVRERKEKYNLYVPDDLEELIHSQVKPFHIIYTFIIVLLAVIMAVTVNAAFIGMYQRRNFEFAVYRAIGVSKKEIIKKIVKELLCMDGIAVIIGGGIFFLALYLFNNLALYPVGKYLRYFHPLALFGALLCNLGVLLPLMVTRSRQMLKADICEY